MASSTGGSPQAPIYRDLTRRYTRASAFSYRCNACRRCCHHKRIRVNPYEVARLAMNRGLSTTEFIERYTHVRGTELRMRDDGACVFLTESGCGVHPDRPLVCRLYPLARHIDESEVETFTESAPHPETEGLYGTAACVADFLQEQAVGEFIDAADRYREIVGKLLWIVSKGIGDAGDVSSSLAEAGRAPTDESGAGVPEILDLDRTVEAFCRRHRRLVPADPRDRMLVHLEAIEAWISSTLAGENRAP